MNDRFLGNAACLAKYDLLMKVAQSLKLPAWYISMLTESEDRNKGDRNATNYRLGSQNEALLNLMNEAFYGEESSINDVVDHIRQQKIALKSTAIRNNLKAENYRIGSITFFNHKERDAYFQGLVALIEIATRQVLFIDPDTGIIPSGKKLKSAKGDSLITSLELKYIMDNIGEDSIVMVSQQLNDYSYAHESRVKDLQPDVNPNIILLVDEVIQSGVYFFTKCQECHNVLLSDLWEYLTQYRFVKSTQRVMLICGSTEGVTTRTLGVKEPKNIGSAREIPSVVEDNKVPVEG
jgi:hypothetical protein